MKIALLGYGKEGQAAEKYFRSHFEDVKFDIFQDFDPAEIRQRDYSSYDIILRSPSVPPLGLKNESSLTRYFFEHCPCPIIGVTATKGKGTTCSFVKSILDALQKDAYLVGNIGSPAIDILDNLTPSSVVVYELSSFQLWDATKSPHVAILGQLEPDHLNIHESYAEYLEAKANISAFQTPDDYLVYYADNPETVKIADTSKAHKIPYPFTVSDDIKSAVKLPGNHNLNNALAAIAAVACYKNISPEEFLAANATEIKQGLTNFKGLPHRLEYLRELNNVLYYDDNFSTNPSSTRVAVASFPKNPVTVILGGRDKTEYEDLPEIYEILQAQNIQSIILIGESGHELAKRYQDDKFTLAESLEEAVNLAKEKAEKKPDSIVLMSPAAASFDMFKNVYDRGEKFQLLISNL